MNAGMPISAPGCAPSMIPPTRTRRMPPTTPTRVSGSTSVLRVERRHNAQRWHGRRGRLGGLDESDDRRAVVAHAGHDLGHALLDDVLRAVDERDHRVGGPLDTFDEVAIERERRPVQPRQRDHRSPSLETPAARSVAVSEPSARDGGRGGVPNRTVRTKPGRARRAGRPGPREPWTSADGAGPCPEGGTARPEGAMDKCG